MSKQFVKGNIYVFTKKKYMQDSCKRGSKADAKKGLKIWGNMINGGKVTVYGKRDGSIGKLKMFVFPEWCKCIKNNNPKIESEEI